MLQRKKLIIGAIITMIIITSGIVLIRKTGRETNSVNTTASVQPSPVISEKDPPQIISTKPDSLINTDDTIVSADEIIEITFNRSLENEGEFKVRIEPKTDFKIEMANGRKTAKIIPLAPYTLGSTYTLFIGPETKFDGVGRWGEEKILHFRTVRYRGV